MTDENEKQREYAKVLTNFADKLMEIFDEFGRTSMENVNEYLREQTYRPTNFIITLNAAVLSASSFFFSQTPTQLNLLSKLLYFGVSLSFISIILEMMNRKDYLHAVNVDAIKRASNADSRRKELGEAMKLHHTEGFERAYNALIPLTQKLEDRNGEIHAETAEMLRPINIRRNLALTFTVASLVSLFSVGLSQIGVFAMVGKVLLRLS